jgi:hypothetical protein
MNPSRFFAVLALLLAPIIAAAQLGRLISPGPLARAHEKLEGASNCSRCHEQGRRVSAERCLECHAPIAQRIAQKKGVHRNAAGDCVACHVEHAGRDAELRPFDPKTFDHRAETGFPLEGGHAIACARCHKTRSYLTLSRNCASCHKDAHSGRLGTNCERCHDPAVAFTQARFDHAKTRFPLEGAHRRVACAKCHAGGRYTGIPYGSCTDCHRTPHKSRVGSDCRSCHTPASWKVANFDHARTGTPLSGRHKTVACSRCHVRAATAVRLTLQPCAACHRDPHRGAFKQDCAACHDEHGFKGAAFDHNARTRFPLDGRHRSLPCSACHKRAGEFRGLSSQCASCHTDPHQAQFGAACEKCHSAATFRITQYEHPRFTSFFAGQHAAVRCEQCHRGPVQTRVYKNLPVDCGSCHRDVHSGQFPLCTDCHSVDAAKFAPVLFDHGSSRFALTGRHQTVACRQCHKSAYRGTPVACVACHEDPHGGRLGAACEGCHTTVSFRVETYTHRNQGAFFRGKHATVACSECHKPERPIAERFTALTQCASCHDDPHRGQLGPACEDCHSAGGPWKAGASRAFHKRGRFPLEGRHLVTPCEECHWNGVVIGTPTRCYDCHWVRRQDDRYRTRLGNECEDCHRPTSWTAVTWDHFARTTFALSGAHRTLACDQCHLGEFGTVRSDCASCHAADYEAAREPNHHAAGYPLVCQLCHRPSDLAWEQGRFTHGTFALAGAHATQTCSACHRNDVYAGTPRDCAGCHRTDYDRSTEPVHAAAGFSLSCDTCHRFTDPHWSDAAFAHSAWPLLGNHAVARCGACHGNGVYAGRPRECVACHRTNYDRAANPNHIAAGFPLTCELCHAAADALWTLGRFSHETFPLAGAHTTASCASCHANGVYAGTSRSCAVCHQRDYASARDPNHVAAGFPTTCETCHKFSDTSWDQGVFTHATFPLAGVHATQPCAVCHANGVYAGTPRTCVGCHQTDYNNARDPNHVAAGFPATCETCHKFSDTSWDQGVFTHATFPLAGVHATQACAACHANGVYAGTPRTCVGCHQSDYNNARDPNHVTAGFPATCETCHKFSDTSWDQGVFTHATFPLAGVHATQPCAACHANGVYAGTPRTCVGCHQSDYNNARDPNHVTAGFPTTCETCHKFSDTSWDQGVFTHATFPLAGVHATQPCAACHANGVYAGTPRTCVGCHQSDYNNARDPNHVTAGFPTTCETCHRFSDTSWDQGTFNHNAFFTLAGVHVAQQCGACHVNGVYAGTPRTCVGCHQSDYANARDPDHIAAGFPSSCDSCHRYTDASWGQGLFNHSTFFTLAGVHTTQPCSACHINGLYRGTPRTCAGCHLSDYNNARDPNHIAAGFPIACDTCHRFSDQSWGQALFNHVWFPIATGRHAGNPCNVCHTAPSAFQLFSCTANCHDRGTTDEHHREVSGYRYDSLACYSCHPQGRAD